MNKIKSHLVTMLFVILLFTGIGGIALAEEEKPRAVVRGNTAVVAIPHEWLSDYCSKIYKPNERFDSFQSHAYYVEESWLRENLDVEEYSAFMADYILDNDAYYLDLDIDVHSNAEFDRSDRFSMSKRYIDGVWYLVFRQNNMNLDSACNYSATQVFGKNKIEVIEQAAYGIPKSEIYIKQFIGEAIYEIDIGSLKISVFQDLGTNIAVISELDADKNRISEVDFQIGDLESIQVSGYMDGNSAIYCCVLSDKEVEQLLKHVGARIQRVDLDVDYMGTNWAVVKTGKFYGLVDQSGTFILDAKYIEIERTAVDDVFIAHARDYAFEIYDANKNKLIASIPHDGGWGTSVEVENDIFYSVYLSSNGSISVNSMEDGHILAVFNCNSEDIYYAAIDGAYRFGADKTVNCFVVMNFTSSPEYYICDLSGTVMTDKYRMLVPLKWENGRGVYLAIKCNSPTENGIWENSDIFTLDWLKNPSFDLSVFGTDAYCGIIDESGNTLVDTVYTSVRLLDSDELFFTSNNTNNSARYSLN